MKITNIFSVVFVVTLIMAWSVTVVAQQSSITLPKGTTVQKMGTGHFKFILPDKRIVEVREFNPKTGEVGYVEIVDPQPPSKPIAKGTMGKLTTTKKLTREEAKRLPKTDYVMIDDEITWLPATLIFQPAGAIDPCPPSKPAGAIDPQPPTKPRGLSPQPDPPGKVK